MAEITLSSAVRNNLLSLQNTASLLSKTQERLSTGLKVNSALDDSIADEKFPCQLASVVGRKGKSVVNAKGECGDMVSKTSISPVIGRG